MITVPNAIAGDVKMIRCDALHVGMPKCGSTFLQHVGFARHPDIDLIWEPGPELFFELRNQIDSVEFDLDDYRERLRSYVDQTATVPDAGKKIVISFEGFCGMQTTNRNDTRLAEALIRLVGPVKVIFLVREQYRVLFSLWGQNVKEGGRLALRSFLNSPNSPAQPHDPDENIYRRVQYAEYLETLHRIFGRDNVGLFFFEDFVNEYVWFMKRLYAYIGVDPETVPDNRMIWRGPNKRVADVFRVFNKFSTSKLHNGLLPYSFFLKYRRWFKRNVFRSERWNPPRRFDTRGLVSESFQQQIRASNRKLASMVDRDLAALGYDL